MDGRLAFGEGWDVFVVQHSIMVGELLVFKYAEVSSFIVQIFGKSGCERWHFCQRTHDDRDESVLHCSSGRKRSASEWLVGLHGNAKKPDKSGVDYCGKPEDSVRGGTPNRAVPTEELEHQTAAAIEHNEMPCILISEDENSEEEKWGGPHKSIRQEMAAKISNSEYSQNKGATITDEEKSSDGNQRRQSRDSFGRKHKGIMNKVPGAKNTTVRNSLKNGLGPRPASVGSCRNLIMELPISISSSGPGAPPKDRGLNASEDDDLRKTTAVNNASGSEWISSLGCSTSEEENQCCFDTHVYQFLVDGQGTCHIVKNSIFDPGSCGNSTGFTKDDADGIQKRKLCSSSTTKGISSPHDTAPEELSASPTLCGRREEYSPKTDQINGENDAQNAHLEALG